jgi:dTDP-3-amino-3,4,6-trideoxy-alpha-D-glucose transaminase
VLTAKLAHLDAWNARRRKLASILSTGLTGSGLGLQADAEGHVYHLFVVRSARRDELRAALAAEGVETLVHYPLAVHEHPAYGHLAHDRLSVSERLAAEVLSLPLHPELTDDTARDIVDAVRACSAGLS